MAQNVSDRNATAPIGIGCRIKPAMVATKMAKSVQAFGLKPSGHGSIQITKPRPSTISQLLKVLVISFSPY